MRQKGFLFEARTSDLAGNPINPRQDMMQIQFAVEVRNS